MEMREILINTKADKEYYLIYDKTTNKFLYRISKINKKEDVIKNYKSLKDVSNVIVEE